MSLRAAVAGAMPSLVAGAMPSLVVVFALTAAATARADAPTPAAAPASARVLDPEILPVMHGWFAMDLGAGVCARPQYAQPCTGLGVLPEVALAVVAIDVLDAHVAIEWRLSGSVGLTDSIGTSTNNPLRTLLGLNGEVGLRIEPSSGWYLAFAARGGLEVLTERFVTSVIDMTSGRPRTTTTSGTVDSRIGGVVGVGWYLDGAKKLDLSIRAVLDTGSIGGRATLAFRLD